MDKLKEMLNQRKAQISDQKRVKVADVEKDRADKYFAEQRELEKKKEEKQQRKFDETIEYYKNVEKKIKPSSTTGDDPNLLATKGNENNNLASNEPQLGQDSVEREPPISKKEIFKMLRARKEPVTLFGETDWLRYERLSGLEKECNRDVKHEEQANIFQKDLELNEDEFAKMIDILDEDIPYDKLMERLEKNKKPSDLGQGEYKGRKKINLGEGFTVDEKCDDVLYWCKKMLKDWEKEVEVQGDSKSSAGDARNPLGQYRQCRRHIQPLFLLLRNRNLNEQIIDALYHIVHCCIRSEYVKGHDKYLELAIGNAPWPMGVTMVGIHERSGRSKIFSSQIAHILNDETQRKYLQAIKRLMTVAQKQAPADYSRNVNM